MPQLQVVDLGDQGYKKRKGIGGFMDEVQDAYKGHQERSAIDEILGEYEKNMGDAQAYEKMQLGLTKDNRIGPTKRLELQGNLDKIQKTVIEKDKNLNAKYKTIQEAEAKKKEATDKAFKDQQESEMILLGAGYEPEEAYEKSKSLSPTSARAEADRKKPGEEFSKEREKSISKYVNESISATEQAEETKFAISEIRDAIKDGVAGPGLVALAKNNPYTQLLIGLTPNEAKLQAANKKMLEGTKGIFGPKPTEREIFLLLNEMLPSIGKTKEANEAGVAFLEKANDMVLLKGDIVDQLTNGGSKYVPDLESQVAKKMKPLYEALRSELKEAQQKFSNPESQNKDTQIKVRAPDGKPYNMTQKQIDAAKEKGVIFEPFK